MNSDNGDWDTQADDTEDLHPQIEELKPVYARLLQRRIEIEEADMGDAERRVEVENIFREQMRAAFLTHSIATEEDFERLWPRLRDDMLCEHAATVYLQVMDAVAEDLDDEEYPPE
jgi:hypothetical protein